MLIHIIKTYHLVAKQTIPHKLRDMNLHIPGIPKISPRWDINSQPHTMLRLSQSSGNRECGRWHHGWLDAKFCLSQDFASGLGTPCAQPPIYFPFWGPQNSLVPWPRFRFFVLDLGSCYFSSWLLIFYFFLHVCLFVCLPGWRPLSVVAFIVVIVIAAINTLNMGNMIS